MAAATVVLPMPISPRARRSAPPAIASMPKAMVATQAFSFSAGPSTMSSLGISRARSKTLKPRLRLAQIWLMAAPPAAKAGGFWGVALALAHRHDGGLVRPRHHGDEAADVLERRGLERRFRHQK